MSSTVKDLSPVHKELTVTVPAAEIEKAADRVYAKLAKEARVRGFRKGRVPRGVLRRMFGKAVLMDVRGDVVASAFAEAVAEHALEPVDEPDIEVGDIEAGKDYQFTVRLHTAPRLDEMTYDGIELERRRVEVPEERVREELEKLRARMATAVELEKPRPAAEGDLVLVELERFEDGEWKETSMPPQEIVLEKGGVRDEFVEALTGAEVGDRPVVELGGPEDPEERRTRFRATVTEIKGRVLPELDDELAKDTGAFDTLEELTADVERRLRESLEEAERDRLKNALYEELVEKNPMELPEGLVHKQGEAMKAQFQGMFGGDGGVDESVAKTLAEGAEQNARRLVHRHFLTREAARHAEIEVTDADVDAELERMAKRSGMPLPRVRAELADAGRRAELEAELLERKVVDFALGQVKVTEVDEPSDAADASPKAGGAKDE